MPTVFAERLIHLDNFSAVFAEFPPERDIRENRHIQTELAGGFLKVCLHQTAAERLVCDFGFTAQESVDGNFLNIAGNFSRDTEFAIVLINSLVQRVGKAEALARFKCGSCHLEKA